MNILVTLDRNYLSPLNVMLTSMFLSNPDEHFDVYLVSDDLTQEHLKETSRLCARFDSALHLISVGSDFFCDAPTLRYYSKAMYYRLLAAELLPRSLDRILYLDPDILIIGELRPLYDLEMGDHLYAACIHRGLVDLSTPVNKLRLSTYGTEGYFNSGVLLMNLPLVRQIVSPQDIFDYVEKNRQLLVLPDQDVLNGLYGEHILPVSEHIWNYDVRDYNEYRLASQGDMDMNWVMQKTAILHFCGKRKPWHRAYFGRFCALYKHYMQQAKRYGELNA